MTRNHLGSPAYGRRDSFQDIMVGILWTSLPILVPWYLPVNSCLNVGRRRYWRLCMRICWLWHNFKAILVLTSKISLERTEIRELKRRKMCMIIQESPLLHQEDKKVIVKERLCYLMILHATELTGTEIPLVFPAPSKFAHKAISVRKYQLQATIACLLPYTKVYVKVILVKCMKVLERSQIKCKI